MKKPIRAGTLNRLYPNLDSRTVDRLRAEMEEIIRELLAEVAREAASRFIRKAHPHSVLAAAPTAASSMVAVYPADHECVALAQNGGEPAEEIHCTLAFLGELAPDQAEQAAAIVRKVALDHEPLAGEVGGLACFDDNGNGYPSIVLPDAHGLAELRHAVATALRDGGIPPATNHGWTPHLTIAYGDELATPPSHLLRAPLTFAQLTFAQGDRRRDFELAGGDYRVASGGLGAMPLPPVYAASMLDDEDLRTRLAEIADRHQPDEPAYGATAYDPETRTVHWVSWDGSSNDEIDACAADFLDLDEVDAFEYEAEGLTEDWPFENVVYPDPPPRWTVERELTAAGPPAEWTRPQPDELVDTEEIVRRFREKAEPVRSAAIAAVAKPALDRAGLAFDATNPFIGAVSGTIGQHITSIADTTRLNVSRIVRNSYEAGLSIPDTAAAIREGMLAASEVRATLIARTEMVGLVNGSSLAVTKIVEAALHAASQGGGGGGGEEGGGDTGDGEVFTGFHKKWLTAPGARDPRHETYEGLDGMTVPLDAAFPVGADLLQYPGDPSGSPEEVCNCRCTVVYVDAAGEETGDEVTAALTFRDAHEEGGTEMTVRAGRRKSEPEALVASASGSTSLPLSDRETPWDVQAAKNSLDTDQYGDAAFWRDPDGDPATLAGYKLWFAKNDGGLTAIWRGVTACAGVVQGARGGVQIPEGDVAGVRRKIEAYYAKAREKYQDDTIRAPWDDSAGADESSAERLAYAELGERESLAYAERVHAWEAFLADGGGFIVTETGTLNPSYDPASGSNANPMTVSVRIRPDLTEFRTDLANGVREAVSDVIGAFDLPLPVLDVRPAGSGDAPAIAPPEASGGNGLAWEAILAPEGKATDDGRIFAPGSISWRPLPLSLMAMTETSEGGHIGAELAGRIDRIWRDDSVVPALIRAEGVFDGGDYGQEIARLVGEETLRGNSVDLAIREVEIGPRSNYVDENGLWKADAATGADVDPVDALFDTEDPLLVVLDASIGMSTVCPFPAFEGAGIVLASADATTPEFGIASDETGFRWTIWLKDSIEPTEVITASAAGYAPVTPPADWFEDPQFEELTGLTVTEDGRVFGHAWAWDTCHIGIPGTCTVAPSSDTDYAYFLLKEIETEDGSRLACGTITLGTGHAGRNLGAEAAAEHYDDTGSAVADVVIGEDEFGGWIAGALRPDVPAARAREFRGSVLSGDWRRIEGNLELVGLLAVNVPGFPVPRAKALVAAGSIADENEVLSLTAAGIVIPEEGPAVSDRSKLTALAARARGGLIALAELAATPYEVPTTGPAESWKAGVRHALTAAGVEEPATIGTSYELTQGTLAERKFLSLAIEGGLAESRFAQWPSDAELADHGEVLFREENEGVFALAPDVLAYAGIRNGWAFIRVATRERDAGAAAIDAFALAYPPLYAEKNDDRDTVPITFWTLARYGPTSRLRVIESARFADVEANYSEDVRGELARLVSPDFEPGKDGQLLIWTGPPGTGKTWALRALASEWASWSEFSYITDPDAFFVRDPSYMIDVLLSESYESLTIDGDLVTAEDAGGKWRILVLEDTGELLSANAKSDQGQGLSRLLNVVDGMVGQGLRVLALVTTNDEIEGFHPAVVRPGRCASQIAFGALSASEASEWLGETVEEPRTLAELYAARGAAVDAFAEMLPCADCGHAFDMHGNGADGGACADGECDCTGYADPGEAAIAETPEPAEAA